MLSLLTHPFLTVLGTILAIVLGIYADRRLARLSMQAKSGRATISQLLIELGWHPIAVPVFLIVGLAGVVLEGFWQLRLNLLILVLITWLACDYLRYRRLSQ